MKGFLKKPLIYTLITMLAVPAWLITSILTAPKASASEAEPTILASWNFPGNPDNSIADGGTSINSTREISAVNTSEPVFTAQGSTTSAASATQWINGQGTKYWEISFNSVGYENITVSSKQYSSATGPKDFKIQYSNNNIDWNDIVDSSIVVDANFTTGSKTASLTSAASNKNDVHIRWIMSSNTAVNGDLVGAAGTSRIDDIVITGSVITSPVITIDPYVTDLTNEDITVTASTDKGTLNADSHTFTENGSFDFIATDSFGNATTETVTITNIDKEKPEITLNGPDFLLISGTDYTELGAVVEDNMDGTVYLVNPDISTGENLDEDANEIDTTTQGIYLLTYSYTDEAGNEGTSQQRLVFVGYAGGIINLDIFRVLTGDTANQDIRSSLNKNKEELINLLIGQGTEITGDEWDKLFILPTEVIVGDITLPVNTGMTATGAVYYEIGAGSTTLNLDIPAKITFPGKAGYRAGYIDNATGLFVEITDVCTIGEGEDYPSLEAGAACVMNIDSSDPLDRINDDLVIWTRHFTTFAAYTETVAIPVVTKTENNTGEKGSVTLTWPSTGADKYQVYVDGNLYKEVTESLANYSVTISGLDYGKNYTITVKAIVGDLSNADQKVVNLKASVISPVVETEEVAIEETPAPVAKKNITVQPQPAQAEEVKEETAIKTNDDNSSDEEVNWTPWIVLFIMIILAGAATGGYFWCFSGQEDAKTIVREAKAEIEKKSTTKNKPNKPQPKSKKKTKRW